MFHCLSLMLRVCVCASVGQVAQLLSCSAAQLLSLLVSLGLALGSHMRFVWSSTQREARQGTARQGLRRKPNSIAFSAFSRVLFSLLFSFSPLAVHRWAKENLQQQQQEQLQREKQARKTTRAKYEQCTRTHTHTHTR